MKNKFAWLSFKRDKHFVRNIVIVVGVILVWRGIWMIFDTYLLPEHPLLSSIISIIAGILILYLPDWSLESLGGDRKELREEIENNIGKAIDIALELKKKEEEEEKEAELS